jgi:WD40 repeat protein
MVREPGPAAGWALGWQRRKRYGFALPELVDVHVPAGPALMPKITISYRRADSEAMTGRICDRLVAHYGKQAVFRDIDDIPAGIDFRQHINEILLKTNVLLAIVGPKWLGTARGGLDRINEESDPVRVEVETALRRRVPIIPVLIGSTRMPSSEQLPPSLKDFAFRNAVKVDTGRDFDYHIERLIKSVDGITPQTPRSSPPSRETAVAGNAAKPAAQAEKKPTAIVVEPLRKQDTGSRPVQTAAAAPAAAPSPLLAVPASSRDWNEMLWPKSQQGRKIRLAAAAAGGLALAAVLGFALWPDGSVVDGMQRLRSLANSGPVSALAFSPDAQEVASASLDKSVNVWNVDGGNLLGTIRDSDGVSSVAFMPNGKQVVYGALNGIILINDADAGERTIRSLKPEGTYAWQFLPAVWSVAVSPDGTRIASGNADGSVKIWSVSGPILRNMKSHDDVVTAVVYAPNGRTIVSGSKDGTVGITDTATGQELARLTDHSGQVLSVALSPDGKWIAAGGSGNTAIIWNAATGRVAHVLMTGLSPVQSVAFSRDGRRLAVGGNDARIEIWDASSGQVARNITGSARSVRALAFSADGKRLASGGDDRTIDIWSAN